MDKAVQTNNCELNNNQYPEELLKKMNIVLLWCKKV